MAPRGRPRKVVAVPAVPAVSPHKKADEVDKAPLLLRWQRVRTVVCEGGLLLLGLLLLRGERLLVLFARALRKAAHHFLFARVVCSFVFVVVVCFMRARMLLLLQHINTNT